MIRTRGGSFYVGVLRESGRRYVFKTSGPVYEPPDGCVEVLGPFRSLQAAADASVPPRSIPPVCPESAR